VRKLECEQQMVCKRYLVFFDFLFRKMKEKTEGKIGEYLTIGFPFGV